MRLAALVLLVSAIPAARAQAPFTLQQVLSAPFSTDLTAAPTGALFAWVEHTEGRNNLWIAGPNTPARQLTHNTADDAQDITDLAWSPDASAIALTFGAETGADGHPANPAHLQNPTPVRVAIQPLRPYARPIIVGDGHSPFFTPDGHSVIFIRAGQIWVAQLVRECVVTTDPGTSQTCDVSSTVETHQLVFDRGSATSLTLSPDGNTLAFISRRSELNQPSHRFLALFDLPSHTLTFPAPSTGNDSAPAFSPDGQHLAFLRSPFTQTPEFAPDRTSPTPWSIQLLDLASNPGTPSASPAITPSDMSSRPKSASFADAAERPAVGTPSATSRTLYTPTPNQPGSVLPHMATGQPHLFWTATNHIIFPSEADGYVHLYSLDPRDPTSLTLLTPGDGEVEDVSLGADRKQVFWASNIPMNMLSYAGLSECMGTVLALEMADIERRHISSVDVTKPSPPTREATKPNQTSSPFAADFTRRTTGEGIETHPVSLSDGSIVALASDSFAPMHPVFVAKDGSLTDVNKQWLPKTYPQTALVFPDEVSFAVSDGPSVGEVSVPVPSSEKRMLHGQLFLPGHTKASGNDPLPWCNGRKTLPPAKNPERHPAILFLHGGPRRQMLLGYPAMGYYSNAYAMNQYLTSRGFIVLSVNYRSGIGYGLNFRESPNTGATGAAEYNDVLAAAAYLKTRPDVDPTRIGIWGGSYGGYLTALALARNSDLFAAGVDFHGVHDWNLEDNASDWLIGSYAQKDAIAARALASSPLADITHWTSPILLLHGDNDGNVAYAQTPPLTDALRARNSTLPASQQVDVEELIFPDELHEFALHSTWLAAYQAAAAFFTRTLHP